MFRSILLENKTIKFDDDVPIIDLRIIRAMPPLSIRSKFILILCCGILAGIALMVGYELRERNNVDDLPAKAVLSVDRLALYCRPESERHYNPAFCYGVLVGTLQSQTDRFCPPANWTMDDAVKIFLAWYARHPDEGEAIATHAIVRVYDDAFGCRSRHVGDL